MSCTLFRISYVLLITYFVLKSEFDVKYGIIHLKSDVTTVEKLNGNIRVMISMNNKFQEL